MMFEHLKKYNKILVTGPQRSGTRIAAKMIATNTGYMYIDEQDFNISSLDGLRKIILKRNKIVVQCPAIFAWIQEFSANDTIIIFMKRKVEDIIASQNRIKWYDKTELSKYNKEEGVISKIKYGMWEKEQKPKIKHWFELEYESLAKHPLWIPKEKRIDFRYDQTANITKGNIFNYLFKKALK